MMRKSVMALMAGLAVLWSASASAELTLQEKAEIRRLNEALYAVDSALWSLGDAVLETSPATRADLAAVWGQMARAHWLLHRSAALLIHANPEQSTAAETLRQTPTSGWVGAAWWAQDGAIESLDATILALNRVGTVPGLSATMTNALARAKVWAGAAKAKLRALDRSLPYADPLPTSYPRMIGPHGNWDGAMNLLALALGSTVEAMRGLSVLYAGETTFPTYAPFRSLLGNGVRVLQLYRHAWFNWALIPLNDAECRLNPFHLVARSFGPMASHTSESHGVAGAPYAFQVNLHASLGALHDAAADDATARKMLVSFVHRWTMAWRWGDGAIWRALIFPDEAALAELRQQGFPAADPFGPPLCDG